MQGKGEREVIADNLLIDGICRTALVRSAQGCLHESGLNEEDSCEAVSEQMKPRTASLKTDHYHYYSHPVRVRESFFSFLFGTQSFLNTSNRLGCV